MQVFVSHTVQDADMARRIAADLKEEGITTISGFDSVLPGESISGRIGTAIMEADAVIVLVSTNSSRSSWIGSEVALALARQSAGEKVPVIPLLKDRNAELPFFLRDVKYMDISNEAEYSKALKELITVLHSPQNTHDISDDLKGRLHLLKADSIALAAQKQACRKELMAQSKSVTRSFLIIQLLAAVIACILGRLAHPRIAVQSVSYGVILIIISAIIIASLFAISNYRRFINLEVQRLRAEEKQLSSLSEDDITSTKTEREDVA